MDCDSVAAQQWQICIETDRSESPHFVQGARVAVLVMNEVNGGLLFLAFLLFVLHQLDPAVFPGACPWKPGREMGSGRLVHPWPKAARSFCASAIRTIFLFHQLTFKTRSFG